ncbi:hypothetical protein Leryth_017092 [Lithospermum erythrorhizon]|nr:hypothetical protein Leryth_017092 [Lithospermum erythrorhizon]
MDANEAISAVVDEGFLGEEDDDYEDLYHDVNVGENVLQSLRKNEELLAQAQAVEKTGEIMRTPAPPVSGVQQPIFEERKFEKREDFVGSRDTARNEVEGFQVNLANRGPSGGEAMGGGGLRVELGQPSNRIGNVEEQIVGNNGQNLRSGPLNHASNVGNAGNLGNMGNDAIMRPVGWNMNDVSGQYAGGGGGGGGSTILFVGDLHWWTTDAELEAELGKYGPVKEVKFFDERASGKSKGYCQVEFYNPASATSCKEGMNGHLFNGRPCIVAFASPFSVKKMGEAQVNRNQQGSQTNMNQGRRPPGDAAGKTIGSNMTTGANNQAGPENNRGFGRGNWGRGGAQGMGGRGGPMRNRGGGVGVRGIMGNGGNAFGQGMGVAPPMMHHNPMMPQGFDPAFGPMGRMGNYGGYPGAPNPPFPGMMPGFPPVGGVGLPGVAPHVNPAFFGRGMGMNGMGMMTPGMDGPNMGMWSDPSMGGWTGDEHGGRVGESSYGEDAVSDHQYEESHDRGARQSGAKEKDRGSGSSEMRFRDDREGGYERDTRREKDGGHDNDYSERGPRDERYIGREKERVREHSRDRERSRDRHRDEKDRYSEHHRYRERGSGYDDEYDRGRSTRNHSKSRISHGEERSRSRDPDYGKRRV